jgi:hypothetical protein
MVEAAEDVVVRPSFPHFEASKNEPSARKHWPPARALAALLALAGCAACTLPRETPRPCVAFHDCYDPADPCAIWSCETTACERRGHDDTCNQEITTMNRHHVIAICFAGACALGLAACCPEELDTSKPDAGSVDAAACDPEPVEEAMCRPVDVAMNEVLSLPACAENIDCDVKHPCAFGTCQGDGMGASWCDVELRPHGANCGDGMACDEAGNCCPDGA